NRFRARSSTASRPSSPRFGESQTSLHAGSPGARQEGRQERTMIAVIFQVSMRDGRAPDYFEIAARLRTELEKIDGFISVERFESVSTPGKYVSLSFWRDEAAVAAWRAIAEHR